MIVTVSRADVALHLRTFGEDELADAVTTSLSDDQLERISARAGEHVYGDAGGFLAKAVVLATIEVIEGQPRQPRFKRRKLKGIYPGV